MIGLSFVSTIVSTISCEIRSYELSVNKTV